MKIHLELTRWDVDVDPVLTADEARELASALLIAADNIEMEPDEDGHRLT